MAETLVVDGGVRLIAVYGGPRGLQGGDGAPGDDGDPGQSITIKGPWVDTEAYQPGDGVSSRSSLNPGIYSLWLVRDGQEPTIGIPPHEEPAKWMEVAAGDVAQQALGTTLPVNQVEHPFTAIGEPVAFTSSGRYELADARDPALAQIAVIADIPDDDNFLIQFGGRVIGVSPDLVADGPPDWQLGTVYYLSSTLGNYQRADPFASGWASQPAVMPVDVDQTGVAELVILTWGVTNYSPPVLATPATSPVPRREGDLWFRQADYPGIYVAIEDVAGALKWVQANG